MDYNQGYEQEIDLKDLLFAVLHRWKMILLAAVVLAVVLGGYKGFSTYRVQNDSAVRTAAQEQYQVDLESYEAKLALYEHEIAKLEADVAGQQEYLEESVLMNIGAYNVGEAKANLFVKADTVVELGDKSFSLTYADTVAEAYKVSLESTQFLQQIAETTGIELRYLRELVSVSMANDVVAIQVKHESQEEAKAILDAVLAGVESAREKIQDTIGAHSVSVANESVGYMVDLNLANSQKAASDRLADLNKRLDAKKGEMKALKEPVLAQPSMSGVAKAGVKFAVVGGVLGAFAVVFGVCVVFLLSGKVHSAGELKSRFRVKILGVMPSGDHVGAVDAWLNRLEGRAQGAPEEKYVLMAAEIQNHVERAKTVLVVGSAGDEKLQQVAEKLRKQLDDIAVVVGCDLLQNVDSLRKLAEVDCVILVEQCNVSSYGEIELMLEKAVELKKEVLGCVVFE